LKEENPDAYAKPEPEAGEEDEAAAEGETDEADGSAGKEDSEDG